MLKNKIVPLVAFAAAVWLMATGCTHQNTNAEGDKLRASEYRKSINAWHQERESKLKGPDGWLTLAGLYWLQEGTNTFGSAQSSDLVFPPGKIPEQAGVIELHDGQVTTRIADGVEVQQDGQRIQEALMFGPDLDTVPQFTYGTLTWFVIKRGDKYGIRLRDLKNDALVHFKGIERYPVQAKWRFEATFEPHLTPKQIPITNIVGQTSMEDSPGTLVFRLNETEYRLDALEEGDQLFVIFSDKTNGLETYGAGRYLYAAKPDSDGKTVLDFNKATNPPCDFVPYATCPLPPRQNFLPIGIEAGEKSYGEY